MDLPGARGGGKNCVKNEIVRGPPSMFTSCAKSPPVRSGAAESMHADPCMARPATEPNYIFIHSGGSGERAMPKKPLPISIPPHRSCPSVGSANEQKTSSCQEITINWPPDDLTAFVFVFPNVPFNFVILLNKLTP